MSGSKILGFRQTSEGHSFLTFFLTATTHFYYLWTTEIIFAIQLLPLRVTISSHYVPGIHANPLVCPPSLYLQIFSLIFLQHPLSNTLCILCACSNHLSLAFYVFICLHALHSVTSANRKGLRADSFCTLYLEYTCH